MASCAPPGLDLAAPLSTGCARSGSRLRVLHPWLHSSAPLGRRAYLPIAIAWCLLIFITAPLHAKTVILNDTVADRMACLSDKAPRQSWAAYEYAPGQFHIQYINIRPGQPTLMRFDLEQIPKGQRITKAELMLPVDHLGTPEAKLYVHRLVAEWGVGVCHQYRMVTLEKKVEWAEAGATGSATDRAAKPTAVTQIKAAGEVLINVTQDVELWNSGAAKNQGWMMSVQDDSSIRLPSPIYLARGGWRLRITYEPQ